MALEKLSCPLNYLSSPWPMMDAVKSMYHGWCDGDTERHLYMAPKEYACTHCLKSLNIWLFKLASVARFSHKWIQTYFKVTEIDSLCWNHDFLMRSFGHR